MKPLALALLLLLASPAPARQDRPAGPPERVRGTRVSIVPPAGFEPTGRFPGYALEGTGASIMVTELPLPLERAMPAFSDPAQLKTKAMRLLSRESATAAGEPAVLLRLGQTAAGVEYLKWVLLIGDGAGTVMVTASFPAAAEERFSGPLRRSLLTVSRDRALGVPPDEGLSYAVAERGALKLASRVGDTLMYSGGAVFPAVSIDIPIFVVGPSLGGAVAAGDRKAFSERRILQTASVEAVSALKSEPVRVDGLDGFETVAAARDRASGRPMAVYQMVLFDGGQYYLMQGLVGRKNAAAHLPSFKAMARSFRRR